MRLLILLILLPFIAQGQIVRTHPYYKPPVSGCSYLLDQYSGAAAAYSLRKLDCDYAGSAIRVRRSSDNTEQDIGFVNGNLDTTALKTFVGTGGTDDGFVVTWYDQSGNSKNVSNATLSQQPKLMDNGIIYRKEGLPSIYFPGNTTSYFLTVTTISVSQSPLSAFSVFSKDGLGGGSNTTNSRVVTLSANGSSVDADVNGIIPILIAEGNLFSVSPPDVGGFRAGVRGFNDYTYNNIVVFSSIFQSSSHTSYLNGSAGSTVSAANGSVTMTYLRLGENIASSQGALNGYISEVILYPSDQTSNRTGIESNINTYYSIY